MPLSSDLQLLPCLTHLAVDVDRFYDEIIRRLRDILIPDLLRVVACVVVRGARGQGLEFTFRTR
jgi:hypothetical protein